METPATTGASGGDKPQDNDLLKLANDVAAVHSDGNAGGPLPSRPRGRPPKHGRYSKAAGSDGKNPVALPSADDPVENSGEGVPSGDGGLSGMPPEMVAEVAKPCWEAFDNFLKAGNRAKTANFPPELKERVEEVISGSGFSPNQIETVSKLTPMVLDEWGMGDAASPTVAVGLIVGSVILNSFRSSKALEEIAKSLKT